MVLQYIAKYRVNWTTQNALHFTPGRPVHSDTSLAYVKHSAMLQLLAKNIHSHFHQCFSQVLIYTAESTRASMERTKTPNLRNGSKGGFEPGLT